MEIVTVTENANFARVKLGDIKPNRFRKLDRYPLEQEVLDALKQSINETGFWSNLQAVRNELDQIELRFGHHRLAAGLELFGPDYEVAVEIVPFDGENNLQDALAYENSIHRNRVAHCHEMVSVRREWWDDKVFEAYPTWEAAVADECNLFGNRADKKNSSILTKYFGDEPAGQGHYAQSVKYGIGREVLLKMLPNETPASIQQALAALPLTARAKRGLEIQQENERRKAEQLRLEAQRINEELERNRKEAEEATKARQAEEARVAAELRKAHEQVLRERNETNRRLAEEKRRAADARMAELKRQREEQEAKAKERAAAKAKAESDARQAEIRAKQKEQVIQSREWFDARAAEVFGIPAHAAEFRRAVSHDGIRPYLDTESLLPFAKAIKEKHGDNLTAEKIRQEVNDNFREFKKTLILKEKEIREEKEKDNPALKAIGLIQKAIADANRLSSTLAELKRVMKTHSITGVQGPYTGDFKDALGLVMTHIDFFNRG